MEVLVGIIVALIFSIHYFQLIYLVLLQYPGDSVVTGRGRINGRLAYVFSQVKFYLFLNNVNLSFEISSQQFTVAM